MFPDSPTWESSSLRQRNVSSSRPEGTDSSHWDPYVKMGKNGGGGGTGSVARSTPNLTELEGLGVGTCLGTWSSTGYISMPSSEEMGSTGGGYCRVGLDGRPAEVQPVAQPNKGYVSLASMVDTSSAPSTANCSPHQASQPPARGYVMHHPLWPSPKEASAGKGYVMAGEVANKVPAASVADEGDREVENITDEEVHSPESYCRFGLRPNASGEPEEERSSGKPASGYVTLPAGGSGYVPHRQFDKREAYQDQVYPSSTSV